MKKSLFVLLICICAYAGRAQTELVVKSNDKGLFINHTVAVKETFYSIGRMYNISPKEIAPFNAIDMAVPLNIGQSIMIPLTSANFSQTTVKGAPVYYVVGEKEGLYRVSVNNGKVLMADLRKWNSLGSDNINPGQKLIVGYLTADASVASADNTATRIDPAPRETPAPQSTVVAPRKVEVERGSSTPLAPKQTAVVDAKGGYFKGAYDQQSRSTAQKKEQTATAGIFKTASGWQDAKYYALMDGVEPGTIVRVINPINSKAVYAKVLGAMSGISQNKGLDVRISNAAANVLSVTDTEKFVVKVDY
ncbi:MAG: LysM peptidoglycan-binding domain-containing protein [Chitinophagaceae bacterium]